MRIAATAATLLFALASCSTTESNGVEPYQQPNQLMGGEITRRVQQIPYQHRDELLENLLWLAQTGEQTIPALLEGLNHESPKVRSSCAWVLGRLGDRRTIGRLQQSMRDSEPGVRLEAARSLVLMGDLQHSPMLIEGLDSDRKEVRYLCHEALKTATGHDYGYDHLSQDQQALQLAVLQWRQWWSEYSGDAMFAKSYETKYALHGQVAAPAGESKPVATPPVGSQPQAQTQAQTQVEPQPQPTAQPQPQVPQLPQAQVQPPVENVVPTVVPTRTNPALRTPVTAPAVPAKSAGAPNPVLELQRQAAEVGADPATGNGTTTPPAEAAPSSGQPAVQPDTSGAMPTTEQAKPNPKPVIELPVIPASAPAAGKTKPSGSGSGK